MEITQNKDISKYIDLVKQAVSNLYKKDKSNLTFFDVITIAMSVVEHNKNSSTKKPSGQEKKHLAKIISPIVVDILVQLGLANPKQADNLKQEILEKGEMIENFIDTAAHLTNNPDLINAGKFIFKEGQKIRKTGCKKCSIL